MAGKWHLGLTKERSPHARGFDRSLALLPACSNHYDWKPEADFPSFLEKSVIALHMEDDYYVQNLPDGCYSGNGYGNQVLQIPERMERERWSIAETPVRLLPLFYPTLAATSTQSASIIIVAYTMTGRKHYGRDD